MGNPAERRARAPRDGQSAVTAAPSDHAHRGVRRLGLQQRFVPLLVALTLVSSLGVAALAYLGERDSAITGAQARTAQDVHVLRRLLADQGAGLTTHNDQLVVGQDNAVLVLNGDTTVVDGARDVTGTDATIYQLRGPALTAIASNLPTVDTHGNALPGSRLLGGALTGPAYDALLGGCGAADMASCHHSYSGVIAVHGLSYVASYAPLYDNNGAFIGALSAATPLASVLAPVTQQAVLLVMIGLLVGMVALVAGYWVFDSISRKLLATLDAQLDAVATHAVQLSGLAREQVTRASRQEHAARLVSEQARTLDGMAREMDQGYASLRSSAGELWAEMSQPGAAPDPARTLEHAKHSAVIAARIGTSAASARDLCRQIVTLMNHILADGTGIAGGGRELEAAAVELRESVEHVEVTLGERLVQRAGAVLTVPWQRKRRLRAQQRRDDDLHHDDLHHDDLSARQTHRDGGVATGDAPAG
ncbi:MAG: Cache 3/Cache 2 fusion domain-containing protein, partial [Ktedonobacterales bacterium]